MANYKNNRKARSNTKAKSFNGKKLAQSIGAVVLTAVIFGGGIAVGYGAATDFKYKRDVIQKVQQEEEPGGGELPGGDVVVSDDEAESPLKLSVKKMAAQASATSDDHTSYEITATLTPANTTDVVDMSIAWASECDENISEYMQLDHADGAFTATVTALKPFSTTINLTAKVRDRDITKTIKLDYLRTIEECYVHNQTVSKLSDKYDVTNMKVSMGEGSICPSRVEATVKVFFRNSVKSVLEGKGFNVDTYTDTKTLGDNISSYEELDDFDDLYYAYSWIPADPNLLFPGNNDKQSFYNAIYAAFSGNNVAYDFRIDVTYYTTVNGVEVVAGTYDYDDCIYLSKSALAIPANDMELNGDYVFWG